MRLYALLLKLYPARFREENEREMLQLYADACGGGEPYWRLCLWLLADFCRTLPARICEEIYADIRHGLRYHARRPLALATAVVALAVAIGGVTGVFSVLNHLLWRALPIRTPERVMVLAHHPASANIAQSPAAFAKWRAASRYLGSAAVFYTNEATVRGGARARRLQVCETTAGFFDTLGAPLSWGRAFIPEEERPGHTDAAVISHQLWVDDFGGDPRVTKRPLWVSGVRFRIVGVAEEGFAYPAKVDVWTSSALNLALIPKEDGSAIQLLGRLADGVTLAQARAAYDTETRALFKQRPAIAGFTPSRPELRPIVVDLAGPARRASWALLGAVALVLLAACGNVASLFLARSVERRREYQIRRALGASAARLVQQTLVESLVLALLSGLAGLIVARWTAHALWALLPDASEAALDLRVLIVAALVTLATGILCGVVPAWHAGREQRGIQTGNARSRLPRLILAGQTSVTIVLVLGAVSLGRQYYGLMNEKLGYEMHGVWTVRVVAGEQGAANYAREALERLAALPQVAEVAAADYIPMGKNNFCAYRYRVEKGPAGPVALPSSVTPGYFALLRSPLLSGRAIVAADAATSEPVAVVNAAFARSYGGPGAVLGRVITHADIEHGGMRVVGVVADVLPFGPGSEPFPQVFVPLSQSQRTSLALFVRPRVGWRLDANTLRSTLADWRRDVPVYAVEPFEAYRDTRLTASRISAGVFIALAVFGLLLAAFGIYATTARTVAARQTELGVRLALGATPVRLRGMLFGRAALHLGVASLLGATCAWGAGRLLVHLSNDAKPATALDLACAVAVLAGAALAAELIALRRITSSHSIRALLCD